jgi:serine/threonine-protein kinase
MPLRISPGIVIDSRYRVNGRLGEGGMGVVWRALDLQQNREVALKALRPLDVFDVDMRRRLLREGRAVKGIQHPCVVQLLDVLELPDEAPILVFELLEGETLATKLARETRIPLPELVELILPIVGALMLGHELGVIHRDIKPDNIFLVPETLPPPLTATRSRVVPKLLDFGVVKLTGSQAIAKSTNLSTERGVVMGTLVFMSPEQLDPDVDVDPRADIYSLGVLMYLCLAGTLPTTTTDPAKLFAQIHEGKHRPLHQVADSVPDTVEQLIMRMLAPSREARPTLKEVDRVLIPFAPTMI